MRRFEKFSMQPKSAVIPGSENVFYLCLISSHPRVWGLLLFYT